MRTTSFCSALVLSALLLAGCTSPEAPPADPDGAVPQEPAPAAREDAVFSGTWEQVVAATGPDITVSNYGTSGDASAGVAGASSVEWTFTVTASSGAQEWEFCMTDLGADPHSGVCVYGTQGATYTMDAGDLESMAEEIAPHLFIAPAGPSPAAGDAAFDVQWQALVHYG